MQWLINLIAERVIATIGIPPVFIDRGDPVAVDFAVGDFTIDGSWHELDLSTIVPAGARAIAIGLYAKTDAVHRHVKFRRAGNANVNNAAMWSPAAAHVRGSGDFVVACSTDRKVDYVIYAATWSELGVWIKGWWL